MSPYSCSNCTHWTPPQPNSSGECRRVVINGHGASADAENWCGKWLGKKGETRPIRGDEPDFIARQKS